MSLNKTCNNINTVFMETFRLLKHRKGFANPWRVPEINFELPFLRALDETQKTVGTVSGHGFSFVEDGITGYSSMRSVMQQDTYHSSSSCENKKDKYSQKQVMINVHDSRSSLFTNTSGCQIILLWTGRMK